MLVSILGKIFGFLWKFLEITFRMIIFYLTLIWTAVFPGKTKYLAPSQAIHINFDINRRRNFICAVLTMLGNVDHKNFCEWIKKKLEKHKTFTHRVVCGNYQYPYFVKVKNFKIESQIYEHTLKKNATFDDVQKKISEITSTPFDFSKPLFSFHLIKGYKNKTFMAYKIHHSMQDGFSCIRLMFYVSEKKNSGEVSKLFTKSRRRKRKKPPLSFRLKSFFSGAYKAFLQPADPAGTFWRRVGGSIKSSQPSFFYSNEKPIKVSRIKKLSKQMGVTFNDLVTSCVAGGLRTFLLKHGTKLDKELMQKKIDYIKTTTWLNMGKKSFPKMLKECCEVDCYKMTEEDYKVQIGCVWFKFPVFIENDEERVKYISQMLGRMISTPEPNITKFILYSFGLLFPPPILPPIWNQIAHKSSFSISNVPGPQHERYMVDKKHVVESLIFATMPVGTITEMFALMSLNGNVQMSACGVKKFEVIKELIKDIEVSFENHFKMIKE